MKEVLLATTNVKKLKEMRRLLAPFQFRLFDLGEVDGIKEVEENGSSFIENAAIKAVSQARKTGLWTIGEDSGLCVGALNGAPGIFSARYAGAHATDLENNQRLLRELESFPPDQRNAFYVSAIVLAHPNGEVLLQTLGECHGRILMQPRGEGGFGYDPLFEVAEYHRTFAELGPSVKSAISHRGRSMRKFLAALQTLPEVSVVNESECGGKFLKTDS